MPNDRRPGSIVLVLPIVDSLWGTSQFRALTMADDGTVLFQRTFTVDQHTDLEVIGQIIKVMVVQRLRDELRPF